MPVFERYIGIDYSGAGLPDSQQGGIQVCHGTNGTIELALPPNGAKRWSRLTLREWITRELFNGVRTVVGIDHAFSFPHGYFQRERLSDWPTFLKHFAQECPTDTSLVSAVVSNITPSKELFRLTEKRTGGAKSVFDFSPNGVAHSTFAGLPMMRHLYSFFNETLAEKIHFWPFNGFDLKEMESMICEVYPAIFSRRYEIPIWAFKKSKDGSLKPNPHKRDAHAVAKWLQEQDQLDFLSQYLKPPLVHSDEKIALKEGWILGVM